MTFAGQLRTTFERARLPGLIAIVVALGDDFSAAEFQEDGEVCAHRLAGWERVERDGERAFPEDFERDGVSIGDFVADFVALAR